MGVAYSRVSNISIAFNKSITCLIFGCSVNASVFMAVEHHKLDQAIQNGKYVSGDRA